VRRDSAKDLALCLALGLVGAAVGHIYLGFSLAAGSFWAMVGYGLAAPALEEAVFRVLLQQGLAGRLNGHAANGVVACAFALAHFAPQQSWAALWWVLPSLVLGELWRRHHSWTACAGVHAWFNLSLLGVTYIF
jgi:membrane protease YdiL (CAAX protease family)